MGLTMSEKILSEKAGARVRAGEMIQARIDFLLMNDVTAPLAIKVFRELNHGIFDKNRVAIVLDHFTPNKDIKSAEQCKYSREFAEEHGLPYFFEGGNVGVEHCLLPELGLVVPGDLVIGADSHTCTYGALGAFATGVGSTDAGVALATGDVWLRVPESILLEYEGSRNPWVMGKDLILHALGDLGVSGALYRAIEFEGDSIHELPMADRFTMSNMVIEAGAKVGLMPVDDVTLEYVKQRARRSYRSYEADSNAEYTLRRKYSVAEIEPLVAFPHLPSNVKKVSEAARMDIKLHQVFIGSCTNGRYEDLKIAAEILDGREVARGLRLIVLPCSPQVYLRALKTGVLETILSAGGVIGPPSCGPCLGGHLGILAAGERALSTSNRNFVGRMGHPESEVYLANPAVAAASAVKGRIAHPGEVMRA